MCSNLRWFSINQIIQIRSIWSRVLLEAGNKKWFAPCGSIIISVSAFYDPALQYFWAFHRDVEKDVQYHPVLLFCQDSVHCALFFKKNTAAHGKCRNHSFWIFLPLPLQCFHSLKSFSSSTGDLESIKRVASIIPTLLAWTPSSEKKMDTVSQRASGNDLFE